MRARSHSRRLTSAAVLATAALLVLSACGSSGSSGGSDNNKAPAVPDIKAQQSVGAGEGTLNLIAWAGYAENGSNVKTEES